MQSSVIQSLFNLSFKWIIVLLGLFVMLNRLQKQDLQHFEKSVLVYVIVMFNAFVSRFLYSLQHWHTLKKGAPRPYE